MARFSRTARLDDGRDAGVALANAFEVVQQLARGERGAAACTCSGAARKKTECTCSWISKEGSRIAVVRNAWLRAGLPAEAR